MMQGFYILAMRRARRQRRIALLACALALCCALGAAYAWLAQPRPAVPAAATGEPYVARSEGGAVVVSRGGRTVIRTDIDVRVLPQADREALSRGISLPDAEALAKLLEDYGS
ncbi:MAG: hypothetical protein MR935_00385 [Agathobaculum sp.]|uniref:hypothetical protein n=1 Tax=Agathobaculum sp. TaxID=2048138 RepID=UPI0025BDD8B3|nr:hypothetical protein [Agathobaculum sp.]MCI7124651.1 hypothetical protein [Agathobaculum sp.]MDY3712263.1 hypothetical protein [Agathobaculum sp.]